MKQITKKNHKVTKTRENKGQSGSQKVALFGPSSYTSSEHEIPFIFVDQTVVSEHVDCQQEGKEKLQIQIYSIYSKLKAVYMYICK